MKYLPTPLSKAQKHVSYFFSFGSGGGPAGKMFTCWEFKKVLSSKVIFVYNQCFVQRNANKEFSWKESDSKGDKGIHGKFFQDVAFFFEKPLTLRVILRKKEAMHLSPKNVLS